MINQQSDIYYSCLPREKHVYEKWTIVEIIYDKSIVINNVKQLLLVNIYFPRIIYEWDIFHSKYSIANPILDTTKAQ